MTQPYPSVSLIPIKRNISLKMKFSRTTEAAGNNHKNIKCLCEARPVWSESPDAARSRNYLSIQIWTNKMLANKTSFNFADVFFVFEIRDMKRDFNHTVKNKKNNKLLSYEWNWDYLDNINMCILSTQYQYSFFNIMVIVNITTSGLWLNFHF